MRVDDRRSTSSEQALGQSCGQADFQNSLPIMLLGVWGRSKAPGAEVYTDPARRKELLLERQPLPTVTRYGDGQVLTG
jgi:hypothetical protein